MKQVIMEKDKKINLYRMLPKKIKLIKKKKTKIKKEKLFIVVSLIIFALSFIVYGVRFIHFYKIEHPKKITDNSLAYKIKENNEDNSKFKLQDNNYIFYGDADNNYVYYSNQLWRVMEVKEDKSLILISNDNVTSMVYGYNNKSFKDSYAYKWLNEKYYNLLDNPDKYIEENEVCISDSKTKKCKEKFKTNIALISYYDYKRVGANKSYLNIGKYFWTLTPNKDKTYYVFDEGGVNSNSFKGNNYYSYGIRPVIKLKNIDYKSGIGTIDDPYIVGENTLNVGAYIKYSNYTFRIYDKESDKFKLVLDDVLDSTYIFSNKTNIYKRNDYNSLYYYLNNRVYYTLNKSLLVDNDYKLLDYSAENNYDYNTDEVVTAKLGLLNASDLFTSDQSNYYLMTRVEDEVLVSNEDSSLKETVITEKKNIRPTISMNTSIKVISGSGTKNDPYVVGE